MNHFKQILCRLIGLCLLALCSTVGAASGAGEPVRQLAMASAGTEPSRAQALQAQVVQWAARKAAVDSSAVQMLALDPRLQVQSCSAPLELDTPFSSLETVRVRCPDPVWQLYVRVSYQDGALPEPQQVEAPKPPEARRRVLAVSASLPRGAALTPDLVRWVEVDAALPGPQALERLVDIEHMELARPIRAGTPIRSYDLRPVLMVKRGQSVLMEIGQGQGFRISARLEALQDGRMGEQIRLKNAESGRQLSGVVMGKDLVRGL
jgi:flagella basal body P-ring formation protein FlgA